ncbi:MAG TPA: response regulator [Candidatus Baltobacteraceae bacterium]|nr:response regulator [Candidatus Baltobacteraceae bacterium]
MSARILVIEDNPANRDLISYLLRAFGYDVECESNGAAGLQSALSGGYDLVLSDILMPDMDGYEFARRFKADPGVSKTPLIAVTALAMTGDRERVLRSGFDGYISKPIDPQKFAGQIAAFLSSRG